MNVPRQDTERRGSSILPRLGLVATIVAFCVSAITIYFLANSVSEEIDALASVNSDTTQWSLAQTEVDMLALRIAVDDAMGGEPSALEAVRRRFDVFYSRVRTLQESRQFVALRAEADAAGPIRALDDFLNSSIPHIDGDDADLLAALPAMEQELAALRSSVREFSLLGVRMFALEADDRRTLVAGLLSRIAALTLALVITLIAVVAVLFGLLRQSARAERQAAESGTQLQEVLSTSIDGVLVVDVDGNIIDYNGAAERIFGYTRAEAIGQDMASLIIPDHLKSAHNAGMANYRKTGERRVVGKGLLRLEARRKDGSVFPVEVTISSAMSQGREIFVSYLRDISQRVADEKELIDARDAALAGEKAKAEMLAVMSHEMRTPLNGLIGIMELLHDTNLQRTQKKYLAAMETSADLLLHHVNGVLNISKADSGQLDIKQNEILVSDFLGDIVESQRSAIEAHGNSITLDCARGPARIWSDPFCLSQVILNLLGNANKFTRNGDILVECDLAQGATMAEFRIIDTGIGIAEADHKAIFDDFKTLDASYGRATEGTGLGLGIARRLIEAMGGEIGLESELGEGSLFWIRVPIQAPAAKTMLDTTEAVELDHQSDHKLQGADLDPMRILLVEDNEINRLVVREMIGRAGHEIVEAHDGREGVALAENGRFDVILMDISMPEMDGIAATGAIRKGGGPNARTPIIALTAHALPDDIERFKLAGIDDIVVKPLSRATLNDILVKHAAVGSDGAHKELPHSETVILAPSALEDLRSHLGQAGVENLVGKFKEEVADTAAGFEKVQSGEVDRESGAKIAHKLAGSAAVLGAQRLAASLREIESSLSREGGQTDFAEFAEIWRETERAMDDLCGTAVPS